LSTTLLTRMTGISLHMKRHLTSLSHGSILEANNCFFFLLRLKLCAKGGLHYSYGSKIVLGANENKIFLIPTHGTNVVSSRVYLRHFASVWKYVCVTPLRAQPLWRRFGVTRSSLHPSKRMPFYRP
jgi:hypothetical protein